MEDGDDEETTPDLFLHREKTYEDKIPLLPDGNRSLPGPSGPAPRNQNQHRSKAHSLDPRNWKLKVEHPG